MKEQRVYKYKNKASKDGTFSCHISKDINFMLDVYCKINGINKTHFVNQIVRETMERIFTRLKEAENE